MLGESATTSTMKKDPKREDGSSGLFGQRRLEGFCPHEREGFEFIPGDRGLADPD